MCGEKAKIFSCYKTKAMITSIKEAERFEELMSLDSHDMPYLFEKIFSAKGSDGKSISEKKFKLLKSVDKEVQEILNKDEKVYFISHGLQTSLAEEYFIGGAYAFSINSRAIIFTTQRILLLQISGVRRVLTVYFSTSKDKDIKPLALKFQIQYSAIKEVSETFFGNFKIKFQNSKNLIFAYLPKKDRKFMEEEIKGLQIRQSFPPSANLGLENLCPYCNSPVEGFPESCRHCWKPFKSASKAGWLSFIFPGFGDLYLGHRSFAVFKIIIAAIFWFAILSGAAFKNLHLLFPRVDTALILFACMHGIDAIWTNHIAKKGIYPAEK